VVQCAHLEKDEFVNGKDDIPYMKWKIKAMIETTNQEKNGDFMGLGWDLQWDTRYR